MRIAVIIVCIPALSALVAPALAMDDGTSAMFDGRSAAPGFEDRTTATRLLRAQRYAEAVPYLNKALLARPNDLELVDELAYAHRMIGDYAGSLLLCQHALARDPDRRASRENLGEVYLKMNRLADARAELAQLQRLCPGGCDEGNALGAAIARYEQAALPSAVQRSSTSGTAPTVSPR